MLSDPKRRAEYDALLRSRPGSFTTSSDPFEQDQASSNFFEQFTRFFQETAGGFAGAASGAGAGPAGASAGAAGFESDSESEDETDKKSKTGRPDANGIFGDVFEDLYVPLRGAELTLGSSPRSPTCTAAGAGSAAPPALRSDTSSATSLAPSPEVSSSDVA